LQLALMFLFRKKAHVLCKLWTWMAEKKASERKMKVSCVRQTSANVLMVNVYIILHCFSGVWLHQDDSTLDVQSSAPNLSRNYRCKWCKYSSKVLFMLSNQAREEWEYDAASLWCRTPHLLPPSHSNAK
jgi:hypothetical protein